MTTFQIRQMQKLKSAHNFLAGASGDEYAQSKDIAGVHELIFDTYTRTKVR